MGARIYVGNIAYTVGNEELTAHFSSFGEVKYAKVVMDRDTGRSKGFGFVEMGSDEEAAKAIEATDGTTLGGRPIRVSEAQERPEGSRRTGGGFNSRPKDGGGYRTGRSW